MKVYHSPRILIHKSFHRRPGRAYEKDNRVVSKGDGLRNRDNGRQMNIIKKVANESSHLLVKVYQPLSPGFSRLKESILPSFPPEQEAIP